jgi:hypothetical protein
MRLTIIERVLVLHIPSSLLHLNLMIQHLILFNIKKQKQVQKGFTLCLTNCCTYLNYAYVVFEKPFKCKLSKIG